MKPSKNLVIIILVFVCLCLFGANLENSNKLYELNKNLDKFGIEFDNWDAGETVFRMHGIPGYKIGFALSNDGRVFWHQIGRFEAHPYSLTLEPGVCSDTPVAKYAYKPSGCFDQSEQIAREHFTNKPACILYDLVNVDRHRL